MNKTIFICEDSFEGILTGVYEAYYSKLPLDSIELAEGDAIAQMLGDHYIEVVPDERKANKVSQAIDTKIGKEGFQQVFYVSQAESAHVYKSQLIFKFLQKGFATGKKILYDLGDPDILSIAQLSKKVTMEYHRTIQFVHFKLLHQQLLFAEIEPAHAQLLLIAPHFEDRFPREHFLIYDTRRQSALLHEALKPSLIIPHFPIEKISRDSQDDFIELWKVFQDAIAIKGRKNILLQKAHVPKRFRRHMQEFTF